jgi:hypothetical protein
MRAARMSRMHARGGRGERSEAVKREHNSPPPQVRFFTPPRKPDRDRQLLSTIRAIYFRFLNVDIVVVNHSRAFVARAIAARVGYDNASILVDDRLALVQQLKLGRLHRVCRRPTPFGDGPAELHISGSISAGRSS